MPLASVVVVAEPYPLNAMVTPDNPVPFNVTWPEMLKGAGVAVKLTPVIIAVSMFFVMLVGLKANPVLLGFMFQGPLKTPLPVKV